MISEDVRIEDLIKTSAGIHKIYLFLYENNFILHKIRGKYFFINSDNSFRIYSYHDFNDGISISGEIASSNGIHIDYNIKSFEEFLNLFHMKDELLSKEVSNLFPFVGKFSLDKMISNQSRLVFYFRDNKIYTIPNYINSFSPVYNSTYFVVFENSPKLFLKLSPGYNFDSRPSSHKRMSKEEVYQFIRNEIPENLIPKNHDVIFHLPENFYPKETYYLEKVISLEEHEKEEKREIMYK
jgi:hypothetical protein